MHTKPHFNKGTLPLAFVFSVPGAVELKEGKPVFGDTGENLNFALEHLLSAQPSLFKSGDRYAYRITNAFSTPLAKSLGSSSSEARPSQILEPENVKRVIKELQGCSLVVLCGRRAQLLSKAIERPGTTVLHAWHTGNRALITKYKSTKVKVAPTPLDRRQLRAKLWAKELLQSLSAARAA